MATQKTAPIMKFQGHKEDCENCGLRKQLLKDENQKSARQVAIKLGITEEHKSTSVIERMKRKLRWVVTVNGHDTQPV